MDALKKSRTYRKTAVSKACNILANDIIDKKNADVVQDHLSRLKTAHALFDEAHHKYHATLETDEDRDVSDNYYLEVDDAYIKSVRDTNDYLSAVVPKSACASEIVSLMSLPKLEMEQFNGDPLEYHSFFALFDQCVDRVSNDGHNKLLRLYRSCDGLAKNAIRSCVMVGGEEGYQEAKSILHDRFGNDHLVAQRITKGLRQGSSANTPQQLQELADELVNGRMVLKKVNYYDDVNTQNTVVEVVSRIPHQFQERWKQLAVEFKIDEKRYPGLDELVTFINKIAAEATDPLYGCPIVAENGAAYMNTATHRPRDRDICVVCYNVHGLFTCSEFRRMSTSDRIKVVIDNNVCENCLMNNHVVSRCRKRPDCNVYGCRMKHNRLLHNEQSVSHLTNNAYCTNVFMPIVNVIANDSLLVHALLDSASNTSYITKRLANRLGLTGLSVSYDLRTMNNNNTMHSNIVRLRLSSVNQCEILHISCIIVNAIPVQTHKLNQSIYPHLSDIKLDVRDNVEVDILLGQDNADALIPFDVRKSHQPGDPYATLTMFGWTMNGPVAASTSNQTAVTNFIRISINQQLDQLWQLENEDGAALDTSPSVEDSMVIKLWDNNCVISDGHVQLPIPWKSTCSKLPDNINVARCRLVNLKKTLEKKKWFKQYDQEIVNMLEKNYAEPVLRPDTTSARTWYLPHQAVPKKNGQLRVVFDCASRCDGVSLNSCCMQGPNFNNKLLHILLRFRQFQYAVMADIESMYNQVRIPEDDRDALRFLWYDNKNTVRVFRMTSHLFGGVWCASSSTYALRKTAEDHAVSPTARDVIVRSFYVDDCLLSCKTEKDAHRVIYDTTQTLRAGGFRLTKFVVNSDDVMGTIDESERAKEVKDLVSSEEYKALGVKWSLGDDVLYFEVNVAKWIGIKLTKRVMLQLISSIFDPLGIVIPIVVLGKIIFQEATRLGVSWDKQLPQEISEKWSTWLETLGQIEQIKVYRCLISSKFNDATYELHVFSDASEMAYGACAYIRCIDQRGDISCSLIMAKSKLAPRSRTTIPRLELEGAVVSVKLMLLLCGQLDVQIDNTYFWIDSEIVLKYIQNETKRFHVYVGNRVSFIRQHTTTNQWYHISGTSNIADVLSRGCRVSSLLDSDWFMGPAFLYNKQSNWKQPDVPDSVLNDDPEVKQQTISSITFATDARIHPLDMIANKFSSWYQVKRMVAWWLKFIYLLKCKCISKNEPLSVSDLKMAELILIKHVQICGFQDEICALHNQKQIQRHSSILSLMPVLNNDGLLTIGGRIQQSQLPESAKHPVILPQKHIVSRMIVEESHNLAHMGREWVIANVREKYWVIGARRLIDDIKHKCITCRKLYASPLTQQMADLPECRLDSNLPIFGNTGLDCFGPFFVKYGRAEIKRYGCLFTCMSTRAVHIEKLNNLESESFINCFRRFTSRRGTPHHIWSDNGTNLIGAREHIINIEAYMIKQGMQWHYIPAGASHMAGAWERLIGSVKRALHAVVNPKCRLTDEILETVFCEVEAIVNNRPLTKLSNDMEDFLPLTPNHLLCVKGGVTTPCGNFKMGDVYRKRWKYVQQLTDQFWRRWLKEYIPTLQGRKKWHTVERNLSVGDLVMIANELTPRHVWPLGIVKEINQGRDGLVRSVRVKTKSTELVRPITKIILLEAGLP